MKKVKINTDNIHDWDSFHKEFKDKLGFPSFYGNNMNAWIDCMTYLDNPGAGMSNVTVNKGDMLVLELDNVQSFKERCREQYEALIEGAAFVNWRLLEENGNPVVTLSFHT